ncbi:MAG TPA: ATP-binding protein [Actinomycetota bacterium]|nr:ATP-binding protein [Actinomycetota bacterium]
MQAIAILSDVELGAFVALALVSVYEWHRRRGEAAAWVAAAFGAVGIVGIAARFIPVNANGIPEWTWALKLLLATLLLFPYFLFRFLASLRAPRPWMAHLAPSVTGLVVGVTVALPYLPTSSDRPAWFQLYVLSLVAQWAFLSVAVAVGLWRAGSSEPAIARRRMRLLASGAGGLAAIVVLSGAAPVRQPHWWTIATLCVGTLAAALFYVGFAPPKLLRQSWRQGEDESLRGAVARLMTARTVEEVAETMIPTLTSLVGGKAAALTDERGRIVGSYGLSQALQYEMEALTTVGDSLRDGEIRRGLFALGLRRGSLLVWASPFTPYFGADDLGFLRYLADLADLALERCELFARERSFIASASHELRTPLTTIAGMAGILTETWRDMDPQTIEDCLDAINRQSVRVRDLVANLLDLAQVENNPSPKPVGAVSVAACGRGALEVAPPPPGRSVDIAIGEGLTAMADPRGLERALTNLLVNAYRYGGPEVRVEAAALEREILLTVSDNGNGVPPELVPRLFDPFTRGATTGSISGSGLGLAITRQLVENFGGRIGYEPGRPRGAKFCVHLRKAAA